MTYELAKGVLAEDYPDGRTRVWGRCKRTGRVWESWPSTELVEAWLRGEGSLSPAEESFIRKGESPE